MNFNRAGICALILLAFATPAGAAVTEPNGLVVPLPVPQVEINLAAGTTPPSVVTLPALFAARGETLDWQKDALTSPSTFSPVCTFTGELVLRGGACAIDFGWYNVVPNRAGPPPDNEIYVLIPGPSNFPAFHPGVGEMGPTFSTASIRADPNYKGGLIGFALKGSPSSDCRQTHFSEQELNVQCTNCTPVKSWAAALIWQSTKTPNAYYIGFEDLAMSPTDFGGLPGQPYRNDGDFNDSVYFLSGVTCSGGGVACDSMLKGVCAAGLTECVTGTTLMCKATVKPSPEVCDGLDNDCNGQTDDMAPCPTGWVCDRGECVPPCTEFCGPGYSCDNKLCVETACIGKTCPDGTVCKKGACVGPCDGVTCPKEQVCRVGRCVDPCEGVTCDTDRVCEAGVCVTHCKCATCGAGKACDKGGRCLESACAGKTCPSGQACVAGDCVDACAGAICPARQECRAGNCVDISRPDGAAPPGAYDGGSGGVPGTTGTGGARFDAATDGGANPNQAPKKFGPDCACTTTVPPAGRWLPLAIAAWAVFRRSGRHRRRRRV